MRPYILQGSSVDLPLSPLGRRQAAAVAEYLADEEVHAVYASPLVRARETAAAIAGRHGLEVRTHAGIIEVDVGRWSEMTWNAIAEEFPAEHAAFRADPGYTPYLGGESYAEVAARAVTAITEIARSHPGETVVVVAHNVVNRAYLAAKLGLPLARARELRQTNACVNVVEFDPAAGATVVRSVNIDRHLGDAVIPD